MMENNNVPEQDSVQCVKLTQNSGNIPENTSGEIRQDQSNPQYHNPSNMSAPAGAQQYRFQPDFVAEMQKKNDRMHRFGIEYFRKIWFVPLIFGALFPFCIYKNEYGIFWPVFLCIALYLVHVVARKLSSGTIEEYEKIDYVKREKSKFSIFCIVTIILLSIEVCTSMSLYLVTQAKVLMLIMTLLYLWHIFAPKIETGLLSTIKTLFISFFYPLIKLPEPMRDCSHFFKKRKQDGKNGKTTNGTASAVIIGLLISVPVLIIVVALLANADLVFGRAVHGMFDWVHIANAEDYILIAMMVIAGIWFSYCIVKGLIEENENTLGTKPAKEKHAAAAAIAFSIPITIVYLIFILIQLIFLLGHFSLPEGMTYAAYAHQGFYQLIAVAIINLVIILTIQHFFDENKALKTVLMILSICTYGMIFSSAARLFMYIDVYAMTFQRIYALFILTVLSVWLGALILKIKNPKKSVMRFCIVSATVMFLALCFSHPDYWMAKYDIAKWTDEGFSQEDYLKAVEKIDKLYQDSLKPEDEPSDEEFKIQDKYNYIAYQLSYDAVPAITNDALRKEVLSTCKNTDELFPHGNASSIYTGEEPGAFQAMRNFNFSRYFAEKSVK